MKSFLLKADTLLEPLRHFSGNFASPLLDLVMRLYMAWIFFVSGWGKFKNFLNDDWSTTVFLFKEVHPLPLLPAEIAAILGTGGELFLPALLALGLFARFGAAGLFLMTCAIQFLVPESYGIAHPTHYFWMLLLAVTIIKGPGILSLDHLIRRQICKINQMPA